jgi:hypothetical protein
MHSVFEVWQDGTWVSVTIANEGITSIVTPMLSLCRAFGALWSSEIRFIGFIHNV